MNFRTTIILALLAVAAGIGLFFVFQAAQQPPTPAPPGDDQRMFEGISSTDIVEIEVDRSEPEPQRVVLVRSGDLWRLREPVDALADADQSRQIASLLAGLRYSRRLDLTPQSARDYGLSPAVANIHFRTETTRHTLLVGAAGGLSTDRFAYVTRPGESRAYLVDAQINDLATADVQAYRSRQLVSINEPSTAAITLQRGDEVISMRKTDNRWLLVEPVRMSANSDAIAQLLRAVQGLEIVQFISEGSESPTGYGFDAPQLVVELSDSATPGRGSSPAILDGEVDLRATRQNGQDAASAAGEVAENGGAAGTAAPLVGDDALRIEFGRYADLGRSLIYVRVAPSAAVYTVSDESYREIAKRLENLRGQRLAVLDESTLLHLELDIDGVSVALHRHDGRWQLSEPEAAAVEMAEFRMLLQNLNEITYHDYKADAARGQAEVGLDNPRGSIKWHHQGEQENRVVYLGRVVDGKQWTLEAGSNVAGAIDLGAMNRLTRGRLAMYDRTIWEIPADEQITRVRWTLDGQTIVLERPDDSSSPEAGWRMTAPREMAVDAGRMKLLRAALIRLRADTFIDSAAAAIDYNLDEPVLRLTLWTESTQGQGRQTNLVASRKDGHWYAMAAQVPLVFVLPDAFVKALERPLTAEGLVSFNPARVAQLEILSPQGHLAMTRARDSWSVAGDDSFAVSSTRPIMYLNDLLQTEAQRVVNYQAANLADYGLDEPQWTVIVRALGGDREILLSSTGPSDGGVYATLKGSGIVSVLDEAAASRIRRDRNFFRQHAD